VACLGFDHATGARGEVGDDAVEPRLEATSYSARRQDSEQYTFPSVCLSQARQKECDQSISKVIVMWLCVEEVGVRAGQIAGSKEGTSVF